MKFKEYILQEAEKVDASATEQEKGMLEKLGEMSLSEIAHLIRRNWIRTSMTKKTPHGEVNYAAVPYLEAMGSMNKITDKYGEDDGKSVVAYFLSNANSWKGEVAKAVKTHLNKLLKGK